MLKQSKTPKQRLDECVDSIVTYYWYPTEDGMAVDFSKISESDKAEISAHLIARDRDMSCIVDNDNFDEIRWSIVDLLAKGGQERAHTLCYILRERINQYYENTIRELIEDRLEWLEHDEMIDEGFRRVQDRQTGEFYWSKQA